MSRKFGQHVWAEEINQPRTPDRKVHSEVSVVADMCLLGPSDGGGERGQKEGGGLQILADWRLGMHYKLSNGV